MVSFKNLSIGKIMEYWTSGNLMGYYEFVYIMEKISGNI